MSGSPSQANSSKPKSKRIAVIDILRGFALCGILMIHVPIFARPGAPPGMNYDGSLVNELILYGLILLVEAKFFSLFSALFGVSFSIQWLRAKQRDEPFAPMFRRRLFFLGLFGVAHILFLWESDILLLYAVVGFILIPFRNMEPKKLLRWTFGLLGVPLVFYAFAFGGLALARQNGASASLIGTAEIQFSADFAAARSEVIRRYTSDDYVPTIVQRATEYVSSSALLLTRVPTVLALFLLGFYVGKRKILENVDEHLPMLRRVRLWGLLGGGVASLLITSAYGELRPFASLTALAFNEVFAGPVLALGYAATLILLARREWWERLLSPLAAYGRMALTNYLMQSVVCGLLFYGYGFDLVMRVSPLQAIVLALVINAALIAASMIWLRFFRYGPIEWLWRSLIYWKVERFRLDPQAAQ